MAAESNLSVRGVLLFISLWIVVTIGGLYAIGGSSQYFFNRELSMMCAASPAKIGELLSTHARVKRVYGLALMDYGRDSSRKTAVGAEIGWAYLSNSGDYFMQNPKPERYADLFRALGDESEAETLTNARSDQLVRFNAGAVHTEVHRSASHA